MFEQLLLVILYLFPSTSQFLLYILKGPPLALSWSLYIAFHISIYPDTLSTVVRVYRNNIDTTQILVTTSTGQHDNSVTKDIGKEIVLIFFKFASTLRGHNGKEGRPLPGNNISLLVFKRGDTLG